MTDRLVKGWCPGALRPMESGDGLIVRLKLTGGIVPLDLAAKIADWSARWGNGQIDLTSRGNLQIRGVTEAGIAPLQDAMAAAGLLDATPEGEAVRNVIASPLAGIDLDSVLDIRPVVAALEARLVSDKRLHGLPAKFCWLVDDGGPSALDEVRADVRFGAVRSGDGPAFEVCFDGAPDQTFGHCRVDEIDDVAMRVATAVLAHSGMSRRMRDLVAQIGAKAIANAAGLPPLARERGKGWREAPGEGRSITRVGMPFGRIATDHLVDLVQKAADRGATELRLTPWRTVLVPLPSIQAAQALSAVLSPGDFILDPADPRLRTAACVGSPACAQATTDVRGDAAVLAGLMPPGALLHVSGCAKGCAHPRSATVTLVGDGGVYNLIQGGPPWDAPVHIGLSLAEAKDAVRRIVMEGKAA